jgi:hypothetical protein
MGLGDSLQHEGEWMGQGEHAGYAARVHPAWHNKKISGVGRFGMAGRGPRNHDVGESIFETVAQSQSTKK